MDVEEKGKRGGEDWMTMGDCECRLVGDSDGNGGYGLSLSHSKY